MVAFTFAAACAVTFQTGVRVGLAVICTRAVNTILALKRVTGKTLRSALRHLALRAGLRASRVAFVRYVITVSRAALAVCNTVAFMVTFRAVAFKRTPVLAGAADTGFTFSPVTVVFTHAIFTVRTRRTGIAVYLLAGAINALFALTARRITRTVSTTP